MNNIAMQHRLSEKIPRAMLRVMLALVVFILIAVSFARVSGLSLVGTPPESEILAKASLYLISEKNGAVMVLSSEGALLANLRGEEGGFISDVALNVDQERRKQGVELNKENQGVVREFNLVDSVGSGVEPFLEKVHVLDSDNWQDIHLNDSAKKR